MRVSDYADAKDRKDAAAQQKLGDEISATLAALNLAVGNQNPINIRRVEAHFQLLSGQYQAVVDHITKMTSNDTSLLKDETLQMLLASAYDHLHQTPNAIDVLAKLIRLYPLDVRAHKEYVRLMLRQSPQQAQGPLEDLERLSPNDPDLVIFHTTLAAVIGDAAAAEENYSKLKEDTLDAQKKKALIAELLKKWGESARLLNSVIAADPKDIDSYVNLVRVYHSASNRDAAIDAATRGLAVDPDNPQLKLWLAALNGADADALNKMQAEEIAKNPDKFKAERDLAALAARGGDAPGQEKHLKAAGQLAPNSPDVWSDLFDLYLSQGRLDEAAVYVPKLTVANFDAANGAIYQARLEQAKGNFKEALQIASQVTKDKPELKRAWLALGDILEKQKQYDQAMRAYAAALDKQVNNVLAMEGMARCEYGLNNPSEALRWINQGLAKQPDNSSLKEMLILHDVNFGNALDAVTLLDQLIIQTPGNPRLFSARGNALLRVAHNQILNGHRLEATATIQTAVQEMNDVLVKFPDESTLYIALADAAAMSGKFGQADGIYQAWAARDKWKESPDPHILLSKSYDLRAHPDVAENEMRTALAVSKNRSDVEIAMVDLLESHKKYDDAIQLLQTVNADNPTMQARIIEVLQKAGRPDEAEATLKEDIAANPPNKELLLSTWANMLLDKKDFDGALLHANEALALDPDDANALFYRARARLRTTPPDSRGAMEDLRKLVEQDPGNVQYRQNLMAAFLELNQPQDAAIELEAVVKLQPKNIQTYRMLIQIYESTGKIDEAIDTAMRGLAVDPENSDLQNELARLKSSAGQPTTNPAP
jgi:tetratricopeptide (TPR) repeat protein